MIVPPPRIVPADDVVHGGHGHLGEPFPGRFLLDHQFRPGRFLGEHQHHALGIPVHLVGALPVLLLVPGGFFLGEDGGSERPGIYRPEFSNA